jgi:hypothetical protein
VDAGIGVDVDVQAGAIASSPLPCVPSVSWRTWGKRRIGASTLPVIAPLIASLRATRMDALRATCIGDLLGANWRMRLAIACLPLHVLRSVRIRFKDGSIRVYATVGYVNSFSILKLPAEAPLHGLAHRSAISWWLTAIVGGVRQTVRVLQA